MHRFINLPFLFVALYLWAGSTLGADKQAFTESVIIFNTICAKCHEAQCSGRLSFDEAIEVSTDHILRHYGEATGKQWLRKELFEILNYMKEKCAYYPMQISSPLKNIWEEDILDKFATLMERNYFIPVGSLTPGEYRIEIELERDEKVTAQLISKAFEWVFEDCYESNDRRISIPFLIEEPGNHYFRMYPRSPVRITRLAITTRKQDSAIPKN